MHTLTDGRDCEDGTSIPLMETLCKDLQALSEKGVDAKVASGGGRMCTTMDRYEAGSCHVHKASANLPSHSSSSDGLPHDAMLSYTLSDFFQHLADTYL